MKNEENLMKSHGIYTRVSIFALSIMLSLGMVNANATTDAGKVIFSFGKGLIKGSDNKLRALKKGAILKSGDEIITKSKTRTQIKLRDGSFFSLKPNTRFKIKSFVYNQPKKVNKSFFDLVRGGFRALTGLIGKRNKSAYRVNTPVATIGIRGTDYDILIIPPQKGKPTQLVTYTNSGAISLTNRAGTQIFNKGQSGFVPSRSLAPRKATPKEISRLTNPTSVKQKKKKRSTNKKVEKENSDENSDKDESKNHSIKGKTGSGGTVNLTGDANSSSSDSFISSPRVISYASDDLKHSNTLPNGTVTTDTSGRVSEIIDGSTDNVQNLSGTVSKFGFGNHVKTGISWGRWGEDSTGIDSNGATLDLKNKIIHWASGPTLTLPSTGTANYQVIGNTAPTDQSGNEGVLGQVNLGVNFTTQKVTNLTIDAVVDSNVWKASQENIDIKSTGNFSTSNPTVKLNNSEASGEISGALTGFAASGAVITYTFDKGTKNVTGAIGLQKK